MIGQFFSRPFTIRRFYDGPLGPYADRFATRLSEHGYVGESVRLKLRLLVDLSWWLQRQGLGVDALDEETTARFRQDGKQIGLKAHLANGSATTLREVLDLLRETGVIPAPTPPIDTPLQKIERDFRQYLTQERRLCDSTLKNILPLARRFLTERFGQEPIALGELRPPDVHRFLLRHVQLLSPARAQIMGYALRSFFRFLRLRGDITIDLGASIPKIAAWESSSLPKSLKAEEVERLLESCDQATNLGQRDYTILLLLARLGLRAGEVVAMTLDDINWEVGQLRVRGKGGRKDLLPIPRDVGKALAHYLRHGRPRCATRRVFVRMHAPRRGFTSSVAIGDVMRRAVARTGIDSQRKGAHLLRHSLATEMLRKGAGLAEIGELLRHRHPDTTSIYAKVDLVALRALALPWPGGEA
jgi:site-specific recombinase XerD